MDTTSNFNFQRKKFSSVEPHDNRDKNKTNNRNIDWRYTKYDVLNQHPINYDDLMNKQWGGFIKKHDKKYKKYHRNLQYRSVSHMFSRRQGVPYRTFVLGFGNGRIRSAYFDKIRQAYPNLSKGDVMKVEASGLEHAIKNINSTFKGMKITDYAVHVDEIKNHVGQAHAQGRIALLGHTRRSGKPSARFNSAVEDTINGLGSKFLPGISKAYHHYCGKRVDFTDNQSRCSLLRYCTDFYTFTSVSSALTTAFPKANLHFNFVRTHTKSVSHEEYERQQDLKHAKSSKSDAESMAVNVAKASASLARYSDSVSQSAKSASKSVAKASFSASSLASSVDNVKTSLANEKIALNTDNEQVLLKVLPDNEKSKASQLLANGATDSELGLATGDTTKRSGTDLVIRAVGGSFLQGRITKADTKNLGHTYLNIKRPGLYKGDSSRFNETASEYEPNRQNTSDGPNWPD